MKVLQMARTISENTSIPLKVIVPVVGAIIGAAWSLHSKLSDIDKRLALLEYQVAARTSSASPPPDYHRLAKAKDGDL